jgi:PAS domain S-box-containing protein
MYDDTASDTENAGGMVSQRLRRSASVSKRDPDAPQEPSITERESEVLVRVQRGLGNKAIAFELGMAEQSVKGHVSVLLRKFGVANRTALAEAATQLELTGERGIDTHWLPQFFRGAEPQISVVRGPDLRIEAVNDTFRRAVGNRPLIGRSMREAFPELAGQGVYERVERVYATGVAAMEHGAVRSWDRGHGIERRHVDLVIQPLRDESGTVNGVISFAFDVTELAEAARGTPLLRDEFTVLLDLVSDGIVIVDETGRVVGTNPSAGRIARAPIDPARPLPEAFGTPLSRALLGEALVDEPHTFVVGDPPQEVRVRATVRPVRDPDGRIRGALAVFAEL